MTNSWTAAGGLVVLAVIFALLAILYWVGAIQFLTSSGHGPAPHTRLFIRRPGRPQPGGGELCPPQEPAGPLTPQLPPQKAAAVIP